MRKLLVIVFLLLPGLLSAGEFAGSTIEDSSVPDAISNPRESQPIVRFSVIRQPKHESTIQKRGFDGSFSDWRKVEYESLGAEQFEFILPVPERTGKFGFKIGALFAHRSDFNRINTEGKAVSTFPETSLKTWLGLSFRIAGDLILSYELAHLRLKMDGGEEDFGHGFAHGFRLSYRLGHPDGHGDIPNNVYLEIANLSNGLSFDVSDRPDDLRRLYRLGLTSDIPGTPFAIILNGMAPWDFGPRFDSRIAYSCGCLTITAGYLRETRYQGDRFWMSKGIVSSLSLKVRGIYVDVAVSPEWIPASKSGEQVVNTDFAPKLILQFRKQLKSNG